METPELNSQPKLTSFTEEEATPINNIDASSNNGTQVNNESDNILNKDIVTRPLLWGIVVFLVFFGLVIGAVSVYRMYQTDDMVEEVIVDTLNTSDPSISTPDILETSPVSDDANVEADLIESEIQTIDSDLEEDIYSDESLGL